jgi:hypothetical protein
VKAIFITDKLVTALRRRKPDAPKPPTGSDFSIRDRGCRPRPRHRQPAGRRARASGRCGTAGAELSASGHLPNITDINVYLNMSLFSPE